MAAFLLAEGALVLALGAFVLELGDLVEVLVALDDFVTVTARRLG